MSDSASNYPPAEPPLGMLDGPRTPALLLKASAPEAAPKGRMPLVLKLTLLLGLTLAFLVAVMVLANGIFWQGVLRKTVDSHLNSVAVSRRDMVHAQVAQLLQHAELNTDRGELRGFLYELATGETASKGNRQGSQETLDRMIRKPVIGASLADANGRVVLSTSTTMVGRDVTSYQSFQAGVKATYFGMPQWDKGRYVAMIAAPVRARSEPHNVYGVLLVMNDVSELEKALRDTTGLGETGDVILGLRDKQQIRFLFPPRNSPKISAVTAESAPVLKEATEGHAGLLKTTDYRGVPVVAAGEPIGYGGWGLMVKMDAKEAYLPIVRVVQLEVLAGLVVMAMGLVAAYFLARRFTRPLRELAQAAASITAGDYETTVPVKSADEFGILSANFNEMTEAIRTRRAERDQAEEALRNADRRKDEFLAMLGHELRNPLSAISNAVRLWTVAGDDKNAVELAHSVIQRQTGNLSRLVDDLLDVSRITEGKIDLRRQPVDVSDIVRRAAEATRPFIEERRHELTLSLEEDTKICVDADPTRLEQIITNLLTNAIKYTRKGGEIRIETHQEGREVVIKVIDNGIGIAPRMLPHIFELFTQGDRSLDRATGGLGIGLNLCRHMAELHGGTITAASEGVGRGSTFTVRLPTIAASEPVMLPQTPSQPVPASRQRRILLVDDNQDTVRSLARLLSLRGHEVATAFDGVAALKIAQEFQPDFLLLDIGLPGLDGYELARRLRAQGFERTPIVAISGYAQEGDRMRSREAGFNYHFAKPVDFEALAELILEDPISAD